MGETHISPVRAHIEQYFDEEVYDILSREVRPFDLFELAENAYRLGVADTLTDMSKQLELPVKEKGFHE